MNNKTILQWIQERYLEAVTDYTQTRTKCNNLFIDLDSLLDQIQYDQDNFTETLFTMLDNLIQLINPQKLIYISLSGAQIPAFMYAELQSSYEQHFTGQKARYIPFSQQQMVQLKYTIVQYIAKLQSTDFPLIQIIFDGITEFKSTYKIQKFLRTQGLGQEYNIIYSNDEMLLINLFTQPSLRQTCIISNISQEIDNKATSYIQINMGILKKLIVYELDIADHKEMKGLVQLFYFLFNPLIQIPILSITRDNLDRFIDRMKQKTEVCQSSIGFIQWFIQKFNLESSESAQNTGKEKHQQQKQYVDDFIACNEHICLKYQLIRDRNSVIQLNEKTQTLQYFVFMYGIYDYVMQNDKCVKTPQYEFCNAPTIGELVSEFSTYNLQICQQMEERLKNKYQQTPRQDVTQLLYLLNTQTLDTLIQSNIIDKNDIPVQNITHIYIYGEHKSLINQNKVIINIKEYQNLISSICNSVQLRFTHLTQPVKYQMKYQLFSQFQTFYGIFITSISRNKLDNYKFINQQIKFKDSFLYEVKHQKERQIYAGLYQHGDVFLSINQQFTLKTNLCQRFNTQSEIEQIMAYIASSDNSSPSSNQQHSRIVNQSVYCYLYSTQQEDAADNSEYAIDQSDAIIVHFNNNQAIRNLRQEQIWTAKRRKPQQCKFQQKQIENPEHILYVPPINSTMNLKYREQLPKFGLIIDFK